ncbi:MAG: hypothetical protein WC658_02815 [Candidatus Omnitrophota bacterium]
MKFFKDKIAGKFHMIVPMKKVTVIVLDKDADSTVLSLRGLGVLHVEHAQKPQGEDIVNLKDNIALINSAVEILSSKEFYSASVASVHKKIIDLGLAARHVIDLQKRREQLEEYSHTLLEKIAQLKNWGDFSPSDIEELSKKNIYLRFYEIPLNQIRRVPEGVIPKQIFAQGGIAHCVLISRKKVEVPFKEAALPKAGLNALRQRLNEDRQAIERIKNELGGFVCYCQDFLRRKKSLEAELECREALRGMGKEGALAYIAGFLPQDKLETVLAQGKKEKWGLLVDEPSEEEEVPVLIRNPRWISLISPIFKFLEILPGYRELDISLPFLIFFSIFFGMLIGDAGYGLCYALLTFFVQRKYGHKIKNPSAFYLFYILSFCAVSFGLLTGTFFGQEWLVKLGIKPLVPALTDQHNIQAVCFFIGAMHLTIAHAWRLALKMPSLEALADLGWILVLWTSFFLAKTLVLGDSFPYFGKWLLVSGLTLVILFSSPNRNILKGVAQGLGIVALSLMNNFTDVVSYVRLFAVGLAGVAIADAFNSMAALVGHKGILAIIVSVFILGIGHTLGIVLGPVSVLVHGVRLNVLEFSGHANVTWSGNAYKPLKE